MSYAISIHGDADSAKGEAKALKAAADLADELDAEGMFSFSGEHFQVHADAADPATGAAREALAAYNEQADEDDKVDLG